MSVRLYEMRPTKQTPVHRTGLLAELVCSNSLKSDLLTSASGLLKAEMRILGSLVIECAEEHRLPAGQALAVDGERYAECVTERLSSLPNVEIIRGEVTELPSEGVVIIASGPLTSDALAREIARLTGRDYLYFYDAVAPTITADSIDCGIAFRASRYGKGDADYLNCPMTEDQYNAFYDALMAAERMPTSAVEPLQLFEGCMPVEEIASRGRQTLAFGPLKPVGLDLPESPPQALGMELDSIPSCSAGDGVQLHPQRLRGQGEDRAHAASPSAANQRTPSPSEGEGWGEGHTAKRPYAVVQLRQENREGTLWGLVGFQTRLKWGEQERVFRMIPGLERAEFVRYGVMHRNTYIESPKLLLPTMRMRAPSPSEGEGRGEGSVPPTPNTPHPTPSFSPARSRALRDTWNRRRWGSSPGSMRRV